MVIARMDLKNRALCYSLRRPPKGVPKVPIAVIIKKKLVKKTDGKAPSPGAISEAAKTFVAKKNTRGRKLGFRKTTKDEDRKILSTFKEVRPDGHGVTSRTIHSALPKKLKKKVSRKTVISRLGEKGFKAKKKISKSDSGPKWRATRWKFAKKHLKTTPDQWKEDLQGVADIKEFTYYPKQLKARFEQLRAPWTYMTLAESKKAAFLRPKRWFKQKDYKKVQKQKAFGLTTSTGATLAFLWPKGCTTEQWAKLVKKRVIPFLKRTFPGRTAFQILLDGEKVLHGPAAKAAMATANITCLPKWPPYSPDMNPQENVWPWAEQHLRELADDDDTFEDFHSDVLQAIKDFPTASAKKLVPGMAKRMRMLDIEKGGPIAK